MHRHAWLHIDPSSHFPVHNLPFGIFSKGNPSRRGAVAIGDQLIDLAAAQALGLFAGLELPGKVFDSPFLNDFMALGQPAWRAVRGALQDFLTDEHHRLRGEAGRLLIPMREVTMHLPVRIGNYTDFYACETHARNVGRLFRPDQPLFPNWKSLPVAYHGRASSVVVSGTELRRPYGQVLPPGTGQAILAPTRALDFELELGCIIGKGSELGKPVSAKEADDYIFGFVLVNDWSARDIQRWEYQPLGPFTSKNFMTSISPWIVTKTALEPFVGTMPAQDPAPLAYLDNPGAFHPEISLLAEITTKEGYTARVASSGSQHLYWTFAQQVAHHTVTGCNLEVGDLLGTGTISGPEKGMGGCLLELTGGGLQPLSLGNGVFRTYLEDGDEVTLSGYCSKKNLYLGFGEAKGRVVPSR